MAGPFKMKGSALYGKGNQSPKSKDPIGDWLRKAGKQLKGDLGKLKSKVETKAQKLTSKVASDVSNLAKTDVPKKVMSDVKSVIGQTGTNLGNIKKSVEHKAQKVTGDIEKGVRSVVSKLPKSKKSETHKKVLKNKFNPSSGWKWVKK